jgi:zeaxanthin glucosyltransferase
VRFGLEVLTKLLANNGFATLVNCPTTRWTIYLFTHHNFCNLACTRSEFPRQYLPPWFHFTGPLTDAASRPVVPFPFEQLTGKPLIYASMGTISNAQIEIFRTIATACADIDCQLVLALGGLPRSTLGELPGRPLVVEYAPQLEMLQRATLTITHGGLNTVLECLANAVPMVVIPLINDQPGVGARVAWAQAGEILPLGKLTPERLQGAIQKVLTDKSYQQNADRLQAAIQAAGGVPRAADIVEEVVATGQPVMRTSLGQ